MSENYNVIESILQAMDIVSNKNLNTVSFDETIECEIIDNSDAKNGHYWVSNGSSRFEAYSEKNSYTKGSKVLVKIPKGDYRATKYIEGLVEREDGQPITYLSAMNTLVDIVELTQRKPIEYQDNKYGIGLIANSEEKTKLIWSFDFTEEENQNLWLNDIYTSFYIEADFQTKLTNAKKGTYGLYFEIGIRLNNEEIITQYYNLNSTEFFGNPYNFTFFTKQSKKFNIKDLKRFETIKLFFSQGGDFQDNKNNDYPVDIINNLFVNNIRVGFGADLSENPDNTIKLITLNSLEYGIKDAQEGDVYSNQVKLDFLWYNKTNENKYLGFSDGVSNIDVENDEELLNIYLNYEDSNQTCGINKIDNILNTQNYDEQSYLNIIQTDQNLWQQKNENTPTDKFSLFCMNNVKQAHNSLVKINDLINKEFKNAINTFEYNMTGSGIDLSDYKEPFLNLGIEKNLIGYLQSQDGANNIEFSFLEYYKNVFMYIAAIQKSLRENPYDQLKDVKRKIPDKFIDLESLLKVESKDLVELNAATYQPNIYYIIDNGSYILDDSSDFDENKKYYTISTKYSYELNPFNYTAEGLMSLENKLNQFELMFDKVLSLYDIMKTQYNNYMKYFNSFRMKIVDIAEKYQIYKKDLIKIKDMVVKFVAIEENTNILQLYNKNNDNIKFWEIKIETGLEEEKECVYDFTYDFLNLAANGYYSRVDNDWEKPEYKLFDNLYSIYWYRYSRGYQNIEDPFITKDWKRIKGGNDCDCYQSYIKTFSKDEEYVFEGTEKISEIINLGLPSVNDNWINNKQYWNEKANGNDQVSLEITLDPSRVTEKFKVILVYNHEWYESNELVFSNIYHPNYTETIQKDTLEIINSTNSMDNYSVYDASNMQLINSNDGNVTRYIQAKYDLSDDEIFIGDIYWYFPANSTQLEIAPSALDNFNYLKTVKINNNINKVYTFNTDTNEFEILKNGEENVILKSNIVYDVLEEKDSYYRIYDDTLGDNVWIQSTSLSITQSCKEHNGYICFSKPIGKIVDTTTTLETDDLLEKFNSQIIKKPIETQEELDQILTFPYRIKDSYNLANINNVIKCELILENGKIFSGNKGFTFGSFGSNGTDYTLIVKPKNQGIISFVGEEPDTIFSLDVKVYDKNGYDVSINDLDAQFVLLNNNLDKMESVPYTCDIQDNNIIDILLGNQSDYRYGILKVIAKITEQIFIDDENDESGETTSESEKLIVLNTLYPISWSASKNYRLSGPTIIPYSSQGSLLNYDKTPYILKNILNNSNVEGQSIRIVCKEEIEDETLKKVFVTVTNENVLKYMPTLDSNKILHPKALFINNLNSYPVIEVTDSDENILFIQPLIIQQNQFETSFLNNWDGSFTIDEDNNTIMSALVGAGIKNEDNTFSGVLLGDVQGKSGFAESGLGIYGFHEGGQSFGFNVDGTAFLGKSGAGRIEFDGNRSVIYSSNWYQSFYETDEKGDIVLKDLLTPPFNNDGTINEGTDGLCINLETGHIDAYNFKLTGKYLYLNANPNTDESHLLIGDKSANYIEYASDGLDIKVTNFSLTYALGENLLQNTGPMEELGSVFVDKWNFSGAISETKVVKTNTSEKKCIRVQKALNDLNEKDECITILQELKDNLEPEQYYTLSGEIYVNTKEENKLDDEEIKTAIKITIGNFEYFITYGNENLNENYEFIGWQNINCTFKLLNEISADDLNVFKIEDYTNQNGGNDEQQHTLLYHLKLEKGKTKTAWNDDNDSTYLYDYVNKQAETTFNNLLTQNAVFNALTDYGKVQGIFIEDNKLYINASTIGAGLLRSNTVQGTFDYTYENSDGEKIEETGISFEDFDKKRAQKDFAVTNINVTEGMLFDLQEGILYSDKFNLKAGELNNNHLILNSDPKNDTDSFLDIGNNTTYIKFLGNGSLSMKVTDFELSYALGENLLYNTMPLEAVGSTSLDGWVVENIKTDTALAVETGTSKRKCIRLCKNNVNNKSVIEQKFYDKENNQYKTKEFLSSGKYYILSGEVYANTSEDKDITFTVGNVPHTLSCTTGSKWYKIQYVFQPTGNLDVFKIEDYTNQSSGSDDGKKHTLLYHLKLEEGKIATAWCQSTQEQNYTDKIYNDVKDLVENKTNLETLLTQNAVFNALTDNGKDQNIWLTGNKLYINASMIGTGLLRSNTVQGTFDYTSDDGNSTAQLSDFDNLSGKKGFAVTNINVTDGTLFDLQKGILYTCQFNLKAGNLNSNHLILNSNPKDDTDSFLDIGNNTTYIKFLKSGSLSIKVIDFELSYALGENLLYNTMPLEAVGSTSLNGWTIYNTEGSNVVETSDSQRKCIRLKKKAGYNPILQLNDGKISLTSNQYYILSGEVYANTSTNANITFTVGDVPYNLSCTSGSKWYKIRHVFQPTGNLDVFKIEDYTNQSSGSDNGKKHTLLYHLKLEKGKIATTWCQSTQEQNYTDKIYDYAKSLPENYFKNTLTQSAMFDKLTAGGTIKGLFMNGNNLCINADAIGTGLLRSNNLNGTFTYTSKKTGVDNTGGGKIEATESLALYSDKSQDEEFNLVRIDLKQGTLFNLNDGFFSSSNTMLNLRTSGLFFQEDYPYSSADARLCLRYAAKLIDEEEVFTHLEKVISENELYLLPVWAGAKKEMVYHYYDVNRDGKITAADARLILRKRALLSVDAGLQLIFDNKGFQILKIETKNGEEIFNNLFCIDQAGVYAKSFLVDNYQKTSDSEDLDDYIELSECLKKIEERIEKLEKK